MLEEKNDNLQDADGNVVNESLETTTTENEPTTAEAEAVAETVEAAEPVVVEAEVEATVEVVSEPEAAMEEPKVEVAELTEALNEDEIEVAAEKEALVEETVEMVAEPEATEEEVAEENVVELTAEEVADDTSVTEQAEQTPVLETSDSVMSAIQEVNAEEGEDESLKERHDIPMLDYDTLSMEQLVEELGNLVVVEKVMSVKDHVEELKKAFLSKYHHFIDEKKDEFHAENPDTTEDFHYHFPLKIKFDQLYTQYRDKKNTHFKSLQNNLQANLETRMAIVEELKNLIHSQESIPVTLKKFNDIRDRWKVAGPIPKDKYNHVWNNYHFHLENFYDILHLDREARDLDFKHNLEQKQKIIARVEELIHVEDINKAFRELQDLHRIWKEDIGPVSRDQREEIWNRFSELTKQMHDKRESLYEQLREVETTNLEKKKDIIAQIEVLAQEKVNSHAAWLGQIEKVEALRNQFFAAGKVPSEVNEDTWTAFKNAVRSFNVLKNAFYKDIKKDQNDNLSKKQALVAKANELKDSTDFAATTPLMKQIQEEWKTIGHVPRKFSDKLWTEFRAACNEYFEKLKEQKSEVNVEEVEAFEKKKAYLETLRAFELVGDHKTDLDAIKAHIETWKSFGKVPFARRHVEGKFNKILDALFEKLSLSKKENEMTRYANRLDNLANNDTRKLDNEKVFLMRKIDEVQGEIFQLENNIQFFANAKADNPMVKEVKKNIDFKKEELATLKEKLKQLRSLKTEE
ncbi:DUF349 domain-containing protein [Flavobacterium sp. IMCC34852]|uniref:DUF349 domain-containing protein n=1 Tax=Flavobacterium rivulicola TaxID=2732161 RepID=A0A7Y3VYE2_9FLAO|nr:DUF349 domain-containing protein [Flavobacterium sp. IMCC34852]NNT71447.1 DUF349 domain-containing protein [Flavobacterium sp. IMCC34852]